MLIATLVRAIYLQRESYFLLGELILLHLLLLLSHIVVATTTRLLACPGRRGEVDTLHAVFLV
jgi:hypothetical protein